MRRTVLSATALACTAVLAGALPAFADSADPTAVPQAATSTPSPVPSTAAPAEESATPEPTRDANGTDPTPVPSQVSVVPSGAPDTGTAPESDRSGATGVLVGSGAATALIGGAGTIILVRRRRANQA